MNRHQVLTGSANAGDRCFAVGSVEGTHFTAYGTGTTVVILASDFQRVQIIPSPLNGSDLEVSGISCCSDLGKIAASYGSKVCIFEPTPLSSNHTSSHRLDYQWYHTGTIDIEGDVLALKWNLDGTRLLTSGTVLEMWQNLEPGRGHDERRPSFFIEDEDQFEVDPLMEWTCVWKSHLANPVVVIKFSSDGLVFATAGENDRLVKIWYEDRKAGLPLLLRSENSLSSDSRLNFNFVYLAHPRAVTGFSWRRTSKYLQKGSIANVLLTSCKDNICRMWCETVLPEDGLVDTQQLEPKDSSSTAGTGQSKKRIVQRLYRIRHAFHRRKKFSTSQVQGSNNLIGALSVPDAQKFGGHSSEIVPSFHFHLAASINLLTDVPLIGSLGNAKNETFDFVIHWLDNKEFHATLEAEKLIDELLHRSPLAEHESVDSAMGNSISSPGRFGNGRKSGLPVIGSDPAITDSYKKLSTTMQKTKSYISMFTGNRSTLSTTEIPSDHETYKVDNSTEQLEHKVEQLMLSWHQSSDMLYGIHPLDGSLLMWVVDNLDESSSGTYGQVKVSLSAMMPNTFPIFDALTMQPNVWLYCDYGRLGLKSLKLESELKFDPIYQVPSKSRYAANATGTNSSGRSDNSLIPNILMVTKHTNGSINMWQISFAENSQFSAIVNVSHVSRASGHRFHTDSSACHPVLPLLLTTSHHESANSGGSDHSFVSAKSGDDSRSSQSSLAEACVSELILWHVASIGPLSKSGGIMELARINSPVPLAFCRVAWFPTLLPVSTLGNISNSPSALFVASDGASLRIYQAVLDGRLILAEQQTKQTKPVLLRSYSNGSAAGDEFPPSDRGAVSDLWNVVSLQSTSRPGCMIDLKPINDAVQNWQNVQLIHVFQELLISSCKTNQRKTESSSLPKPNNGNLRSSSNFEERFYLVVIEQMAEGNSVLTMWLITIASQDDLCNYDLENNPDSSLPFCISVDKVYCQFLPLPKGVFVTMATVAAGHLSSSSIYPACFAPYLLSTACTDGRVRFWQCSMSVGDHHGDRMVYQWQEWRMMTTENQGTSLIEVEGKVLSMSSAYSGRLAIAHRLSHKFDTQGPPASTSHFQGNRTVSQAKAPSDRLVSLFVSVFECESTGGAKWTLEDTIEIPNVVIADPKVDIDLSVIFDGEQKDQTSRLSSVQPSLVSTPAFPRTSSVPSFATVQSIRRILSRTDMSRVRPCLKHRTHLDWVSTEDGSHILTVSVGSKIHLYTAVSVEPRANHRRNGLRGGKQVSTETSYTTMVTASEVRWVVLRSVELHTADGLPPLPKHLTWVRNGILVVGMENEVHTYSQWKLPVDEEKDSDVVVEPDRLTARPSTCASIARCRTLSKTMSGIKLNASIANLSLLATKRARRSECSSVSRIVGAKVESAYLLGAVDECGLFEAARLTSPCLPQYHPRQLLELLAFGKTRCVRLVLCHLLRCLAGRSNQTQQTRATTGEEDTNATENETSGGFGRSPLSATASVSEESEVNFLEVTSIPPLPLYVLLSTENADASCSGSLRDITVKSVDYEGLFNTGPSSDSASVGSSIEESTQKTPLDNQFGRAQAQLLARYLEHTQLPDMSSLEQTNLLALADAMAKTTAEVEGNGQPMQGLGKRGLAEIIDDCGLRFLVAAQQHASLISALSDHQGAALQHQGLPSAFYIWAFHSKSKQELLESLPWKQKEDVTWNELRQFGVGWWLTDIEILTHWIEKIAKTAFQVNKDPMDVALFYIAMRKKNVLCGLFKLKDDSTRVQFFKNNFSEERWRKAALKNAFHLLGRQRFHQAAAFFLLAGAVTDALQVCLRHLKDFQLVLIIIRLYEGGTLDGVSASCRRLLNTEILGFDETGRNYNPLEASHDPFLRSMAYWLLDDHKAALETLLVREERSRGSSSHEEIPSWKDFSGARASVFNVYRYLRSHTQVIEKKFPRAKGFSGNEAVEASALSGITPVERQLYFQTAHTYFRAGCPLLALEVLTNLPQLIDEGGAISEPTETTAVTSGGGSLAADVFSSSEKPSAVGQSSLDFDWSQPVTKIDEDEDKLDLSLGSSLTDEEDEDEEKPTTAIVNQNQGTSVCDVQNQAAGVTDVMAQQLNFIACVKILVNELSTLATGFEVDGGQLRFQLYIWLEKEMEVLRKLCYTGDMDENESDKATDVDEEDDLVSQKSSSGLDVTSRALHETILNEKSDFDAKLYRMARRKKWLKAHEQVLSTLLGYSILHATSASGLASMQMELLLLLQELQQTKMPQQLQWPIPFPTTLPLLAASIASAKTVISDPIQHLQGMCQDLLHTLIEFKTAPATDVATSKVCLLRDLSIALSSCVYQCLCDSDSFVVSAADDIDIGLEGFTSAQVTYKDSYLMAGAKKRAAPVDPTAVQAPTSLPASWPGVSSLVTLMNQKCDEDGPLLQVLLMEALVAVFMSLVCYALSVYDAIVLYRLVAHPLDEGVWPLLFGGGYKRPIRVAVSNDMKNPNAKSDHNANIRSRLHRHVFGPLGLNSFIGDDRSMYQEQFIPPQMNMISYFLAKVKKTDNPGVDYDSADSVNSDDDEDDEDVDDDGVDNPDVDELKDDCNEDIVFPTPKTGEDRLREHVDPNSYSWCLMRYAVIKYIGQNLRAFLPKIGMELTELPTQSPLVHSVKKNLEVWEGQLRMQMEAFSGPPKGYIPGCSVDSSLGVNIVKYSALANPDNTPFLSTHYSALPAKRLWNYLVTRECLQDVFIRYILGKGRSFTEMNSSEPFFRSGSEAMKVIYKDQETIACFSILPSNSDCVVVATQKELVEMNISQILYPVSSDKSSDRWDNIEVIRNSSEALDSMDDVDTCIIQPSKVGRSYGIEIPVRRNFISSSSSPISNGLTPSALVGHGGQVVLKRPLSGVKKIGVHPQLPYYLTGLQDGSLRLWELGRSEVVGEPRRANGSVPKLTRVLFNSQGNKFGVSDVDGSVCLWQLGHNLNLGLPFVEMKCHNKGTNDFVFVGSSSLFATAGHSSDNFNVCLWDTLLPKYKALVKGFHCYSDGCSALVYAPCHQAIISGGKKGELYIFDVRQRQLRHTFQAHQSAIKCISFDPTEDSFATGSADGEVKVWGLTIHNLLYTFSSERSRSSRFRSSGTAISELYLGPNGRLFSSSTDGSLKLRQLTYKHNIVNTWQNESQTDVTHF